MYVYWFGGKNENKKNKIFCSKAINIEDYYWFLKVTLDPNGTIKLPSKTCNGVSYTKVPFKEGEILYRTFWLEKQDDKRALEIVNNYFKEQAIKALDKIAKKNLYTKITKTES